MLSALSISGNSPYASSGSLAAARGTQGAQGTATTDAQLEQLKATDRKVRAHEAAHLAAAGSLAIGGASYTYTRGSDGQFYATGGEVSISLREGRTASETLSIAEQIGRAALAPADPSSQDRSVAARAAAMASEARASMLQEQLRAYRSGASNSGSQVDVSA